VQLLPKLCEMNNKLLHGLLLLLLSTFACRPVVAISWNEFLIIGALFTVLLGPPLYRLIRRVEKFFKRNEKNQ
jgi:hypothetical protein